MRRDTMILTLMLSGISGVYAQYNPNSVYASEKSPIKIEAPSNREILGGTIINVTYEGPRISNTLKGAFEYACRLMEERMPTIYPLNIKVQIANFRDNQCLAMVEPIPIQNQWYDDRAYYKRSSHFDPAYTGEYLEPTLDFFKGTDAVIKFSANQPFDYNLNPETIQTNKYDFITVALQALIKAVGFSCKTYSSGNSVMITDPSNKYTCSILSSDSADNYKYATSGQATIKAVSGSNDKWLLVCNAPYRPGISLNYYTEDPSNKETAIMQYGIAKGSYIRYVGNGIKDFFSFCGWDRPIITGSNNSTSIKNGKANDVIAFQGINSEEKSNTHSKNLLLDENDDLYNYITSRRETGNPDGYYILLKDGSWEDFRGAFKNLTQNEKYARSADGHLRIKNIYSISMGTTYSNKYVSYELYSYLPQKPDAALNNYQKSTDAYRLRTMRPLSVASNDDIYIDVEIGLKNLEGTTKVVVEQTDSDYPVTYSYIVENPKEGKFIAYMNKSYPSTFKLTYINSNGKTIGDSFVLDLREKSSSQAEIDIALSENNIQYRVNDMNKKSINLRYSITDIHNGSNVLIGHINQENGNINISSLHNGNYILSIYENNHKLLEKKWIQK